MSAQSMSWDAARKLLREIRDVMTSDNLPQQRLDRIVDLIASQLMADVCSLYLRRAGDVLELFATQGLKSQAVHKTRLRIGEGLVGFVAARNISVRIEDAQAHPYFAYRPETGEELFHSFMGVPLLRGAKTSGVLTIQHKKSRHYSQMEKETLETIAMVIAEMVVSTEIVNPLEAKADGEGLQSQHLSGVVFHGGLALGRAFLHEPKFMVKRVVSEDLKSEQARFRQALAAVHRQLDEMLSGSSALAEGEERDILETYRMFAEDRGWLGRIDEAMKNGLSAEAAVGKVLRDTRQRMSGIKDPYIRERLQDIEDLGRRLLAHLTGTEEKPDSPYDQTILVARSMGPAELLDYPRHKLVGVVLEEGSGTSHVSIVAKAMGIPVLGRVRGVLDFVENGTALLIDSRQAQLHIRPPQSVKQGVRHALKRVKAQQVAQNNLRDKAAISKDGHRFCLMLNAGLPEDLAALSEVGADGVGLFRTEIPFMLGRQFPSLETQIDLYKSVFEQADGKQVVFRTLDAGGDKKLPYWEHAEEDNPAMGWRAIRISLERPMILRTQLRAMIRAAEGRPLHILMPMIAHVAEFQQARDLVMTELDHQKSRGYPLPEICHVGAMIEVPSLCFQLPQISQIADFMAVGSNDLCQFMFASDRDNPRVAAKYDPLSAPILSVLSQITAAGQQYQTPISLCGELAGSPLEAMALAGMGYRRLSMSAGSILAVKQMIRALEVAPLQNFVRQLHQDNRRSVREQLRIYAQAHQIPYN